MALIILLPFGEVHVLGEATPVDALLALLALLILGSVLRLRLRLSRSAWAMATLFVVVALAVSGFGPDGDKHVLIVKLVEIVVIIVTVELGAPRPRRAAFIVRTAVAVCGILAAANVVQVLMATNLNLGRCVEGPSPVGPVTLARRCVVAYSDFGAYSSYVLFAVVPGLLATTGASREFVPTGRRAMGFLVLVTCLGGVLVSGSRSSWLSAGLLVTFALLFAVTRGRKYRVAFAILVGVAGVALLWIPIHTAARYVIQLRPNTWQFRLALQHRAVQRLENATWIGTGYASTKADIAGVPVHNAYLTLLMAVGPYLASVILLYILSALVGTFLKMISERTDHTERALMACLLGGIGVSLVEWSLYFDIFNMASWLFIALAWHYGRSGVIWQRRHCSTRGWLPSRTSVPPRRASERVGDRWRPVGDGR